MLLTLLWLGDTFFKVCHQLDLIPWLKCITIFLNYIHRLMVIVLLPFFFYTGMSKQQYKLIYFNARGRGELSRLILHCAGVPFEDFRFEMKEWPAIKSSEYILKPTFILRSSIFKIFLMTTLFFFHVVVVDCE